MPNLIKGVIEFRLDRTGRPRRCPFMFVLLGLVAGCAPLGDRFEWVRLTSAVSNVQASVCQVLAFVGGCTPAPATRVDTVQVAEAVEEAQAIADNVCRPDLASAVDFQAGQARLAIDNGRSPLAALQVMNAELMKCNLASGRRTDAETLARMEAPTGLDLNIRHTALHPAVATQIEPGADLDLYGSSEPPRHKVTAHKNNSRKKLARRTKAKRLIRATQRDHTKPDNNIRS
jgi:hypothetical protein